MKVMEPLFRGHLFVRTDLKDSAAIRRIAGEVRVVSIGACLMWIPDSQVGGVRPVAGRPGLIKREPHLS